MTTHLPASFTPGHVFRTRDLAAWSANPTRLVKRWVDEGVCVRLRNGLYSVPRPSKFGAAPPAEINLLRAFLGESPFVVTGPPAWNALRLGSTQVFTYPLVYNQKRSGQFELDERLFNFRRVRFPEDPCLEWFVVDFLNNLASVCLSETEVEPHLAARLREGMFDHEALSRLVTEYGTRATQALLRRAMREASH